MKKFTYIFKLDDPGVTEDGLYRLAEVLNTTTAYRASSLGGRYTCVQVFTDTKTMIDVLHRAAWTRFEDCLHLARHHGETAVALADQRLRACRRPPAPSILRDRALRIPDDTARLNWLEARGAGLNCPNSKGGKAHVWLDDGMHYYDQTYREVIDRAMRYETPGSPPPVTRRSKRSA